MAFFLTFPEFQASRRESANVAEELGFYYVDEPVLPGFIYAEGGYIEKRPGDQFFCLIGRSDWLDKDLAKLERILWACHYLQERLDEPVLKSKDGTLDDYIVGYCDSYGLPVDGDTFSHLFSGQDDWPLDRAEAIMVTYLTERRRWRLRAAEKAAKGGAK